MPYRSRASRESPAILDRTRASPYEAKSEAWKSERSNLFTSAADGPKAPDLQGEAWNIAWLLLLYTLQGIPMGLFAAVSMQVKDLFRGSFSAVGTFSIALWPFSLKLLWAPLVDACYIESFGRRKTWIVPAQLIMGIILFFLSRRIEALFEAKDIETLTCCFFGLYLMAATQDIAVDGWGLTMLRPENAQYASTCNAIGQTLGFIGAFLIPLSGWIAIPDFLMICSAVFGATTAALWLLKREAGTKPDEEVEGLQDAYTGMRTILAQKPIQILSLLLLTRSFAFQPADVMAAGRLQDAGFPKESIASIKLLVVPVELMLPWLLTPYTSGPRPLSVILKVYIPRTALTVLIGLFLYSLGNIPVETPFTVYVGVLVMTVAQGITSNAMFVAHMCFFTKMSDPKLGGTSMTLLNTVHNLGNSLSATICLKLSDWLTSVSGYDGFNLLCGLCAVYGVLWFAYCKPWIVWLQEQAVGEDHTAGRKEHP